MSSEMIYPSEITVTCSWEWIGVSYIQGICQYSPAGLQTALISLEKYTVELEILRGEHINGISFEQFSIVSKVICICFGFSLVWLCDWLV